MQSVSFVAGGIPTTVTAPETQVADVAPPSSPQPQRKRYGTVIKIVAIIILILLIMGGVWLTLLLNSDQSDQSQDSRFQTVKIPLEDFIGASDGSQLALQSLVINGRLQANASVVIAPSTQPQNSTAGQIYYDQTSNLLAYYNGTEYIDLTSQTQIVGGSGITNINGQLTNTGVLSFQGQTGDIVLTAGNGITIDGTTISAVPQEVPLTVANGGTGATTLPPNGVLIGQGDGAITGVVAAGPGLCLQSTAGAPAFSACPGGGGGGVTSLNGLSGALTINDAVGAGNTITINDASTAQKGIAQFNATNFTAAAGVINTIQNISTTSSPTFGQLTLTGDLAVNGGDITSTGALNITPAGTLTAGSATQQLILQGNANTQLTATGGGFTTTVGFTGTPTGNIVYNFDRAATAGTYAICTTAGNCVGTGGGVTTSGGTVNRLAKFTAGAVVNDSTITDDGTNVTTTVDLIVQGGDVTIGVANSQTGTLNFAQSGSAFLGSIVQGALTANRTYTLPNVSGELCTTAGNCSGSGSANTLQAAYDAGNTISTSDARNILFTLTEQTTDPSFLVNLECDTSCSTNGRFAVQDDGTDVFRISPAGGAATFQNSANSTTALRVLNQAGTTAVLTVDTSTPSVLIQGTGTAGSGGRLFFGNDSEVSIGEDGAGNSDILALDARVGHTFYVNGTQVIHTNQNGQTTMTALNDSGGLIVLANGGNSILRAAGDGSGVAIGYNADNIGAQLVLDTKLNAGDPTGVNGGMYYNAAAGKFRCFEASAWVDCLVAGGGGLAFVDGGNSFGQTADLGTNDNFGLNIRVVGTTVASFTAADGAANFQNSNDSTSGFNVENESGGNLFTVDTQNSRVGINLGGAVTPQLAGSGLEVNGSLRLSGAGFDTFVTPNGTSVNADLNIAVQNLGDFNQIIAVGVHAASADTARAISIFDDRAVAHQPSVAVFSPNESQVGGFSWDGSDTDFFIKNSASASGTIGLKIGTTTRLQATVNGADVNGRLGITVLEAADNSTFLCRNSSNFVAACNTTGTGVAFVNDGNSFGGLATLGTNDAFDLNIETSGVTRMTIESDGSQVTFASNVDLILQGATAYISNPQAQTQSEAFGLTASVTGSNAVATGYGATAAGGGVAVGQGSNATGDAVAIGRVAGVSSGAFGGPVSIGQGANADSWGVAIGSGSSTAGNWGTAVGQDAQTTGQLSVALGQGANANGSQSIALGAGATTGGNRQIAIGNGATTTADNQMVIGGNTVSGGYINQVIIGSGVTDTTPQGFTLQGTGGSGTNIAGANVNLAGGQSTGNAAGGSLNFQISTPGGSGTALNSLATVATISGTNGAATFQNSANSTSAFRILRQNNDSLFNVDSTDSVVDLLSNNTGHLGTFTSDTDTISARAGASQTTITLNGYGYVLGGCNVSNATTNTVQHAKLNANGSVDPWSTTSATLPASNCDAASAVYNGYIYVAGGTASSTTGDDIFIGRPGADGTISSWRTLDTQLPDDLESNAMFAFNGWLYVVGGQDTGNNVVAHSNDVSRARINSDGTLGEFITQTDWIPANRMSFGFTVANGYIYLVGGKATNAGAGQNTLYYGKINADGSLATAVTNTAPGFSLRSVSTVFMNGKIYALGGNTSGSTYVNTVQYAPLSSTGSVGTWTTDTTILPDSQGGMGSFTSNGYVYLIGGSNSADEQNDVWYASGTRVRLGASLDLVGTSGGSLTDGSTGGQLTAGNTYIAGTLNISGNTTIRDGLTVVNDMTAGGFYNTLGSNTGHIDRFATETDTLPAIREGLASTTVNGYLYGLGGCNGGSPTNTTYYARINANGSTGAWASSTTQPLATCNNAATSYNGYLYVSGGTGSAATSDEVYYAKVNSDGTTSTWKTASNTVGIDRVSHAMVAYNGYLYVIGGEQDDGTDTRKIHYARLNADGSPGTFVEAGTDWLPASAIGASATVANGYLYVADGGGGTVYYGKLNADGTIAAATTEADTFASSRSYTVFLALNGYLYAIGGGGGTGNDDVYYAPLNNDGSTGAWVTDSTLLPANRGNGGGAVVNGYIYFFGGWSGSAETNTVFYASGTRVKVGASLDLVGMGGESLADGSTGGSLAAGNTTIAGLLDVTGAANLKGGAYVGNNLTVTGSSDTTGAFSVVSAAGTLQFTVDTTNSRVFIGDPTADATGALLVLDTKNTSGDPTGVMGAMYYNSNRGKMRCFEYDHGTTGAWRDCIESSRTGFRAYNEMFSNQQTDYFSFFNGGIGDFNQQSGEPGHPGIMQLDTDTGGAGEFVSAGINNNLDTAILLGGGDTWRHEVTLRVPTLSTAGEDFTIRSGFSDAANADATDGCFFKYNHGLNGGEWQGVCTDAGASTCDSNIAVVAGTWYRLTIVINSTGTSTDFQINGTSVCQVTANIPDTAGNETGFTNSITKNVGTIGRFLEIDYIEVRSELTPR